MKPLGDRNAHFWMVQRMAQVTDTDLVAAMQQAELSQEDWAEMVEQCRGCDWETGCCKYLESHERADQHEAVAPEPCQNRKRFLQLKDALEAQV